MHFKSKSCIVLLLLLASTLLFGCLSQYRFSTSESGVAFNSNYQPIRQAIYSYREIKSINVVGEISGGDSSPVMNTALLIQSIFLANKVKVNVIFKSMKNDDVFDYCLSTDQNAKLNASECQSLITSRFTILIKSPASTFDNSVLLEKNQITLKAKTENSLTTSATLLLQSIFPNTNQVLADIQRNVESKQSGVTN